MSQGAYPGFCSMKQLRVLLLPLNGMQYVASMPYGTYTPGWRETMSGRVSCLRKQQNGRDWASNQRPSDLKSMGLNKETKLPMMTSCMHLSSNRSYLRPNENAHRLAYYINLHFIQDAIYLIIRLHILVMFLWTLDCTNSKMFSFYNCIITEKQGTRRN